MIHLRDADVARMTDTLFIERDWRSRSSTKFWVLLVLAAIIATAGVVADSDATVIGAMIVAPLMTPILGSALALVLADRPTLIRSIALVLGGALLVIAIACLISIAVSPPDDYAGNSQVQARLSPRLIDLLAALATGTVGAFALVRSDISDALPGVAIAISLVPPLAVVGLLLQVHRYTDASQAALLFGTNVAAIIATGTAVFLGFRVRDAGRAAGRDVGALRGRTLVVVGALVLVVAVPLTYGTYEVTRDQQLQAKTVPLAAKWARSSGWRVVSVEAHNNVVSVTALGPPPDLDPGTLRRSMDAHGLSGAGLLVHLVLGDTVRCTSVCVR